MTSYRMPETLAQYVAEIEGQALAPEQHLYLLLDGARLPDLATLLEQLGGNFINLFGASLGTPLFAATPTLLSVERDAPIPRSLANLLTQPQKQRAASLLSTELSQETLAEHLEGHLHVTDPDGELWGLAVWDPYILAALAGSQRPVNLLVPGPVLTPEQHASLLGPMRGWYFQHRDGTPNAITLAESGERLSSLVFDQRQMNDLADLALPDQVWNTLRLGMPELADMGDEMERHAACCHAVSACREEGKETLADYCAAAADTLLWIGTATARQARA